MEDEPFSARMGLVWVIILIILIQGLLCFQISMALHRTWKPWVMRRKSVPGPSRCLCVFYEEKFLSSERFGECFKFCSLLGHEYMLVYKILRFWSNISALGKHTQSRNSLSKQACSPEYLLKNAGWEGYLFFFLWACTYNHP